MATIFDQIESEQSAPAASTAASAPAAASGSGNIFDQIEAEHKSAPASGGNVFDQIEAKSKADPLAPGNGIIPSADQWTGYSHAHPILGPILHGAAMLTGQSVDSPIAQFMAKPAANRGAVSNAVAGYMQPFQAVGKNIAQGAVRTGLVAPPVDEGGPAPFQSDPTRVSGKIGQAVGMTALGLGAGGVGGPIAFGTNALSAAKERVASQRAAGHTVTPTQAAQDETGQTILGMLQGSIPLPAGASIESAIAPYVGQLAAKIGSRAATSALTQWGFNDAGNLVTKVTVDPNQKINQGAGESLLFGGLTGGIHGGLMENATTPNAEPPVARPEAPTEKATQGPLHAPGNLPGHPTRAETPEELAQQPYDFQALRERMANPPPVPEGQKPVDLGKPMTAEQEAAAAPVAPTGEAPEHPEQVEALQERLHELDRRLSKIQERRGPGRATEGRRAEDVGPMPEGEFKTPEELGVPKEGPPAPVPAPTAEPAEKPSLFQRVRGAIQETPEARETSLSIRKSLGEAENAGHQFEASMKPAREHVPTFSDDPDQAKAWADSVEAGETPPDATPEEKTALQSLKDQRMKNAQDAADLGIKHLDVEGEGLSRLFDFPDNAGGRGTASVAGTNNPFRGQKYDTFSEAYDAAIDHGGKPRFDNPLDMQIARQYEVEKSLSLRRNMREQEDSGHAKWIPDGQRAPEGMVPVNDRILGTETRKESLPVHVMSKIKGTPYEVAAALDAAEAKGQVQYIRPGPEVAQTPPGYGPTGKEIPHMPSSREKSGTFYMKPDVAAKFNNFSETAPKDNVADFAQKVARGSIGLRYTLSMGHAAKAAMNTMGSNVANAFRERGDIGATAARLMDAATGSQITGSKFRRSLEAGQAGEAGERVMAVNPALRLRSVVGKDQAGPIGNIVQAVKAGDIMGGLKAALRLPHDSTFNEILPNMVAAHLKGLAERQIRQGISAEAGRPQVAAESEAIQNLIGAHIRSPEFRNTVTRSVAETLIPAERYWEGQLRNVKNAVLGDKAARAAVGSAFVGTTATVFAMNAALQMLMTKLNTGTAQKPTGLEDLIHPRMGQKDENGNEARLNIGSSVADAYAFAQNPVQSTANKFNPAINASVETYENKDRQGNQVRPDEDSTLGNLARGAGHIGKSVLSGVFTEPFKDEAPEEQPRNVFQKARDTAMQAAGVRVSHPVTSPATQTIFDALHNKSEVGGRDLRSQDMETSQARWVQEVKDGRPNSEIAAEMADKPWITDSIRESVAKRAAAPTGIGSLVYDTKLSPQTLATTWDKATPEEREQMKAGLQFRLDNVNETAESKDLMDAWQALHDRMYK